MKLSFATLWGNWKYFEAENLTRFKFSILPKTFKLPRKFNFVFHQSKISFQPDASFHSTTSIIFLVNVHCFWLKLRLETVFEMCQMLTTCLRGKKVWISRQMLRTFAERSFAVTFAWSLETKCIFLSATSSVNFEAETASMMSNVHSKVSWNEFPSHVFESSSKLWLSFALFPTLEAAEMYAVTMTIHQSFVLRQRDSFIALVLTLFINTPSSRKCHFIIDFSTSDYSFFFLASKQTSERVEQREKFWALRDFNIPDISCHHSSLSLFWPWLNFTYHPKTYRSITR